MNIENKSFEFLLTNATKKRMTIALEPWGETRQIEVGASVRVNVESPSTDPSQTLELKVDDKGVIGIWAGTGAAISVLGETWK
ncbi:MAG: hypothetical protein DMG89_24845 [Acidobacteria bacterium]|jgi:hypothetical protein|nr:MAG: hypothetical protein DMG89_24845 [Acidobacteriota bacterium]